MEAETANGDVIIQYATVLEMENTNIEGNKYWMKTIFYLLDNVSVDIIVDRRLMRLLGLDQKPLSEGEFRHKAVTSNPS